MISLPFLLHLTQFLHETPIGVLIVTPLILILLDVISGIACAVREQRFTFVAVSAFLGNHIYQYMGALAVVVLTYFLYDSSVAATTAATLGMGVLALSTVASIRENVVRLFPAPVAQAVEDVTNAVIEPDIKQSVASAAPTPAESPAVAPTSASEPAK